MANGTNTTTPFDEERELESKLKFSNLQSRQIVKQSSKTNCNQRPHLKIILEKHESPIRINANGTLSEISSPLKSFDETHYQEIIKDIIGDNMDLILKEVPPLPPLKVLDITAKVYEIVNVLHVANQEFEQLTGSSDIFGTLLHQMGTVLNNLNPSGIFGALGKGIKDIAEGLGSGGGELIRSIGDAIGTSAEGIGSGIGDVLSKPLVIIAIAAGAVLFILIIGIVIYKSTIKKTTTTDETSPMITTTMLEKSNQNSLSSNE
jgi:hypothetical protein